MNNVQFEHLLLTCFNIKRVSAGEGFDNPTLDNKRNSSSYLDYRFNLFESITFPSVCNQSCNNFTWLVFFDINTPEKYRQKNLLLQQKWSGFNPIYVENKQEITKIIKKRLNPNIQYLITTNLDNDDAICSDFIQIIQSNLKTDELYLLNLPIGLMFSKEGLFLREYLSSPFQILVEKVDDNILSCLKFPHHLVTQLASQGIPTYQIPSKPAWLQIVHGSNVRNQRDVNSIPIFKIKLKDFNLDESAISKIVGFDKHQYSLISFYRSLFKNKKKPLSLKMKLALYTLIPEISNLYNKLKWNSENKKNTSSENKKNTKEIFIQTIEHLEQKLLTGKIE